MSRRGTVTDLDANAHLLTLEDITRAADVLRGVVNRTPVVTSRTLDERLGARVFLKCESFQRSGSFKFRGASNKVLSLPSEQRARGVCSVSSGNHAQALALAAQQLGIPAAILMPRDAPPAKLEATRAYGAEVVLYDRYSISQAEAGRRFQEERGLAFVSSHDDPIISAGAGTAALELFEEVRSLDVLVAPIGGGGGISGHATVAKELSPQAHVVGVEPSAGGVTKRSLEAGERLSIEVPATIADGQQLTTPGKYPFEVMRHRVDEVVLVDDADIVAAMAYLFDRLKIVTEPSGAIAVAALLAGKLDVADKRVGVMVTGGNVGIDRFRSLVGAGSTHSGVDQGGVAGR